MRERRVGTLSMGILLIIVGVGLIIANVFGISGAIVLLKWWPVIIIAFGIEMLAHYYFCGKEHNPVKYDGLSVFLALILIFFSVCGCTVQNLPKDFVHKHVHGDFIFFDSRK